VNCWLAFWEATNKRRLIDWLIVNGELACQPSDPENDSWWWYASRITRLLVIFSDFCVWRRKRLEDGRLVVMLGWRQQVSYSSSCVTRRSQSRAQCSLAFAPAQRTPIDQGLPNITPLIHAPLNTGHCGGARLQTQLMRTFTVCLSDIDCFDVNM